MPSLFRFSSLANLSIALLAAFLALITLANPARGQAVAGQAVPAQPSYVELVELALAADIVARVQIDDQATLRPERAPDVAPGNVRIYAESITQALLGGRIAIGESLAFLVDLPADARGRAPKLKKQVFLIFARSVEGRPGQVFLAGQGAMQPATPELEQRVRHVLTQLAQNDRPPVITGVREAMSVPGNLVGESETQIFLETRSGDPVSLSIIRRPGMTPQWGVSWTDIVDQAARPPQAQTLEWYALACFLPVELPEDAFIQSDRASRDRAREDYRMVQGQLGGCVRNN